MNCSPDVLKDYLLGELPGPDCLTVEAHVRACPACSEELERLRTAQAALASVPDVEMPQRIAFVSDRVFEPGWWQRLWNSAPRLGFVSAMVLAAAILVHGLTRPAPAVPETTAYNQEAVEARIEAEVSRRIPAAVAQAVAERDARLRTEMAKLVATSESKMNFERRADLVTFEQAFTLLKKQVDILQYPRLASSEMVPSR